MSGLTLSIELAQARPTFSIRAVKSSNQFFKFGDRGPLIYNFLEELRCAGYYTVGNDSYYGPVTKRAVSQFQRDNGLTVDGIAGPQTRNALKKYNSGRDCQSIAEEG